MAISAKKAAYKEKKAKAAELAKLRRQQKAALTRMIKKAREDGTFDSLPDDIKAKCLKHEAKREKAAYFYNQWKRSKHTPHVVKRWRVLMNYPCNTSNQFKYSLIL
ncbi:hypothetical protein ACVXHU_17830 [Escherichia coli]